MRLACTAKHCTTLPVNLVKSDRSVRGSLLGLLCAPPAGFAAEAFPFVSASPGQLGQETERQRRKAPDPGPHWAAHCVRRGSLLAPPPLMPSS